MECLNVVAGLRIMILVVLVCSVDTIFFSFVFVFFGCRSVVLLFLFVVINRIMLTKAFTSVMIIIQVFFVTLILYSAGIVLTIVTRMMDSIVTWVLASIGTGIVRVATIRDGIFTGLVWLFFSLVSRETSRVVTAIVAIRMGVVTLIVAWNIAIAEVSVDGVFAFSIRFLFLVLIGIEAGWMVTAVIAVGVGMVALVVAWDITMAEVSVDGVSTLISVCFLLLVLVGIPSGRVVICSLDGMFVDSNIMLDNCISSVVVTLW